MFLIILKITSVQAGVLMQRNEVQSSVQVLVVHENTHSAAHL